MSDYTAFVLSLDVDQRYSGKAIAIRLAEDGFSVCINDIAANSSLVDSVVSEIKALGRDSIGHIADVSKSSEVESLVLTCVEKLGPLTVMIANAAIAQMKPILEMTDQDIRGIFDVNVIGVFNCYSAAAKQMIKQGSGGKLIGAASIASFRGSPGLGHYCASKAAVRSFTQTCALELAPHKITVNGYAPGIVDTPIWDMVDDKVAKATGSSKEETLKQLGKTIALGRLSVPEDVAKFVSYLASPDSDYMTGQTVVIDGGIVMN
jgi:acetoin reductase-like protein